jgi:TolB protein
MKTSKTTALALIGAAAAAAAIALPATAHADPDASPAPAAHGVEAPLGAVPWAQVGPGWTLAMWSPAANTTTVLLGPPVNGGTVLQVLPYANRN